MTDKGVFGRTLSMEINLIIHQSLRILVVGSLHSSTVLGMI